MLASIQGDIEAAVAEIIADNSASIVIRRGSTTLAAQDMRIERSGGSNVVVDSASTEETRGTIIILGSKTLDIQKDDRFTYGGHLYKVRLVRPNRQTNTQAEADLIQ